MPYEPPAELAALSLEQIAQLVAERRLPPVSEWSPAAEADSRMRIAADGRWYHDGGEITRPAMVRAFASLLTRDAECRYWLVTPQERQSIEVEDAAFIAIDCKREGDAIAFRLNTDDLVVAGPDHPIIARGSADTPALYIAVRNGLEARLNRSTYAQIAEIALEGDDLSVSSQGARFSLVPG
jgi:hypothetical protein